MLKSKQSIEAEKKDVETETRLDARLMEIQQKAIKEAVEKVESLKRKLTNLLDEKRQLFRAPLTRGEILSTARENLKKSREKISLEVFLGEHLKRCAQHESIPLDPERIRVEIFPNGEYWKILW